MVQNIDISSPIPAGILAAMAVGSQLTQSTLNTFHVGNDGDLVSKGVPRIQEIFNNSCSVSRLVYTLDARISALLLAQFDNCAHRLEAIMLKNIVEDDQLVNEEQSVPSWTEEWQKQFGQIEIKDECVFISVPVSCRLMVENNVLPIDLFGQWNCESCQIEFVACSRVENNIVYLLFRGNLETEKILGLSENISEKDKREYFVEKITKFYLLNQKVKGLDAVAKCWLGPGSKLNLVTSLDLMPDKFTRYLEQISDTITGLVCSRLDEMYRVFGIEVACKCLIYELCSIMPDILKCHIELIAKYMTLTGKILPISRYTIRTLIGNSLQKISFEEATKNLVDSCQNGEVDYLTSVSSRVAASKVIYG